MAITINDESIRKPATSAVNWADRYWLSGGFEKRYKRKYGDGSNGLPAYEDLPSLQSQEISISDYNKKDNPDGNLGVYFKDGQTNNIYIDSERSLVPSGTAAHEFGHLFDNIISSANDSYQGFYSDSYNEDIFNKSKAKQELLNDPEVIKLSEQSGLPAWFYTTNLGLGDLYDTGKGYNASSKEHIANLYYLRSLMFERGYYDASLADSELDEETLNRFMKENPDVVSSNPLFRDFTIQDILYMDKYVANNGNNKQDNQLYYAKHGLKLIPKKRFIE